LKVVLQFCLKVWFLGRWKMMRVLIEITEGESATPSKPSLTVTTDTSSNAISPAEILAKASIPNALSAGAAPVEAIAQSIGFAPVQSTPGVTETSAGAAVL
jgi:hypothetical protein